MPSNYTIKDYSLRDADYYMDRIPEAIIEKLSTEEHKNIKDVISSALPKPSPKLIDVRFVINLLFARYFFVLLIGKDRYKKRIKVQDIAAPHHTRPLTKIAHRIIALLLFFAINLLVSGFIVLFVYVTLSFLGIHLFSNYLNTALRC
ncbi:hypothetical protein H6F42_16660 [Pseudanabaena sp. FACHB-1998]|uniref:hypothetical protein n=1 Tax=Pseudanabaena sp. FACHB-1998 TaxID=2692858 RepID=UPI001680D960|nr:hypothetical protein [Pseudanabaena sp. FACHB-1998]MBD2178550.1 hypothetical protein [Pseudanabaena sp. FACHB-1998]